MISHFNLPASDNSFYFEIARIQEDACGLKITGIVGDGSAEAWFEAGVGERLQVCVFPIWEGGSDSLCQRYEQSLIEQGLANSLEEVSFRSEKAFDSETGCWQQKIVAIPRLKTPSFWTLARYDRPRHQVCETGAIWQRRAAC